MVYKVEFVGDGLCQSFDFPYPVYNASDLIVKIDNVVQSADSYSVSIQSVGARVSLVSPLALDSGLEISRRLVFNRAIDYQDYSYIVPNQLNSDFNYLLEVCRDIDGKICNISQSEDVLDRTESIYSSISGRLNTIQNTLSEAMSGGTVGLFYNLLDVLGAALPSLINDYGSVAEAAVSQDDYGCLS